MIRVYGLAKMLAHDFDVTVVGPSDSGEIWAPIAEDTSIDYRMYRLATSYVRFAHQAPDLARRLIDGDVILSASPLLPAYGLALAARAQRRRPLLLDIHEWDIGTYCPGIARELLTQRLGWFWRTRSPLIIRYGYAQWRKADALTVTNTFLQRRYGGHWIPQVRDERAFEGLPTSPPQAPDSDRTVMFLGTPRSHKGLDDLVATWQRVRRPGRRLRIVGSDVNVKLPEALRGLDDDSVTVEPAVALSQAPATLAAADVVGIPQKFARATVGQLPAKLIEAMAASKAIVATDVGDMALWLAEDSGLVVPHGNADAMADGIDRLLEDPNLRARLGANAKRRYLAHASFAAVRPRLVSLIERLLARRNPGPALQVFATAPAHPD
ncbi:MAG: glycosyltransferase [Gammaproteobacteria bacterium]